MTKNEIVPLAVLEAKVNLLRVIHEEIEAGYKRGFLEAVMAVRIAVDQVERELINEGPHIDTMANRINIKLDTLQPVNLPELAASLAGRATDQM